MERDSKSQVYTVRQHSPLPWQRSSAAIPKSPCWEAKTAMGKGRQQQETHSITEIQREGRRETWQGEMQESISRVQVQTRVRRSTQISRRWEFSKTKNVCLEMMQGWDIIMATGEYIALKPDVHFTSQWLQLCLCLWKTHPLMFQLNKQQQCRRKMLQREAAVLGYMGSSNPTHTVLSANISHLNGERLFGEELHIGPTALNPPIEY